MKALFFLPSPLTLCPELYWLTQAGYSVICDQHNWETNDPCVILPRQQCTTHDDVELGGTHHLQIKL